MSQKSKVVLTSLVSYQIFLLIFATVVGWTTYEYGIIGEFRYFTMIFFFTFS